MAASPRPLRVLSVGPERYGHGGISSVVQLQAAEADRRADVRFEHLATFRDGSRVVRIRAAVRGSAGVLLRLARRRTDVLHLHVSFKGSAVRKGLLITLARAFRVPTVLHAHGSEFMSWFDALPGPAQLLFRHGLRASAVVVLAENLRPEYASRLRMPLDRVTAVENPVELPAVAARHERGDPVTLVFLGRFGHRKGIFDLVSAIGSLPDEVRTRLRVVAAGDGQVAEVRQAVSLLRLDHVVTVSGWLAPEAKSALLARSQILALPSYHEGLPMAVLEGMATGLAPLVTPVGGLSDLIEDGRNGVLVEPGDVAAIAAAVSLLVTDEDRRAAIGAAARNTARGHSVPPWFDRLETIWRRVSS